MRKNFLHKLLVFVVSLGCLGFLLLSPKPAQAANPATINFQGKVVNSDGTNVANNTYSFIFRIYNTASPTMTTSCTSTASCLWQETQGSVTVTNGVFQVELGAACALTSSSCSNSTGGPIPSNWSSSSLYLTMQFNGDTSGSNGGFMSPTIHLTSVPFAFNADNLGGISAANYVQLAQGLQTDGSSSNASIAINKTAGTANILTLQKSGVNVMAVNNSGTLLLGQAGTGGLNGSLVFNTINASSTSITISAATTGTSYSLILPTTGPSVSQCLQNDASTPGTLIFSSCGSGSGSLSAAYTAGSAGDQVITLSSTNDSIIIRNPSSSGSNSGTVPLLVDQLATGAQGGLTVNLAADSSIAANTRTGLTFSSGAITEATANTGNLLGADITIPGLTTSNASAVLNAYGLRVTTGSLTQTSGSLLQNGIYVDSGATTFTTGGTLNGLNINVGAIAAVGTYKGINISTNGTARTFTAGASVTGLNLDLNTNVTAVGVSMTGLSVQTAADTNINAATKKGLSVTSGNITQGTNASGTYVGADITLGNFLINVSSGGLFGYGLRVTTGNLDRSASAAPTLTENGIYVDSGSTTFANFGGTLNGINVNVGAIAAVGTYKGINISTNGTARTFTVGASVTGLNLDLNTNVTATGVTMTGLSIQTAADTTIGAATKKGLAVTSGAISNSAGTGTYVGGDFTVGALTTTSTGVINANGLRITTGNLTQTAGTITENGLLVDSGSTTFTTGGTLNGLNVNVGAIGAAGTYKGINISSNGTARTFTAGASITGLNLDLNTNVTAVGVTMTGLNVQTAADTAIAAATKTGLSLSSGAITETTASTGTYNGLLFSSPGAIGTTTAAGTLNWNGAAITNAAATANFAGSTINENGLKITTGSLTETAGTLLQNGLSVDATVGTFTSGTLNGIKISNVTDPGAGGTSNALTIGTGWDKQVNGTGWSVDGTGNLTVASCSGCGGGGGTLASTYNSAATTGNTITYTTAGAGIVVQDASSPLAGSLLTLQNNAGTVNFLTLNLASSIPHLKIYDQANNAKYADIYYDDATSTAIFAASSGTTTVGSGSGPITIVSGAGAAITITGNAASTWSTSSGLLTLQGGSGISVDSASTSAVTIGNGASSKSVTVGNQTGTSTLTLQSGSGNVNLSPSAGNDVVFSQGAGSILQLTASAATTADQLAITNASGATSTTAVNGASINFNTTGSTASADNSGLKIDVTSNNSGATTTLEGLKISDLSSAEANSTETGLYVGTGWDIGLNLQSGGIQFAAQSDPATPASGNLRVYAKLVSGRTMLKAKGSSGVDIVYQPALFGSNVILFTPTSGTTATGGFGTLWAKGSSTGTQDTPTPATTAPAIANQIHRFRHRNLVTTTNQVMGIQNSAADGAQFWEGNAAGLGGFFYQARFIIEAWPANTVRLFVGLSSSTTGVVASDTVAGDVVGLWHDTTDGANVLSLVTRNNATTTKTAISGGQTLAAGQAFDFYLYVKPNDTTIYYRLDSLNSGTTLVDTSFNGATLGPRNTIFMGPQVEMSNGTANTTVNTVGIGVARIYVESDN